VTGGVGVSVTARAEGRWDAALFGEAPSRIVVSLPPERVAALRRLASRHGVPVLRLGRTGGDRVRIRRQVNVALADAAEAWGQGLRRALWE
ncbi:MAG: phosphoribosylformylglycinamidine synthase II, partial [Chloroflexota bacterium]|nr:phosphoribosylformylglycinamidine synthase II [Chloroflexota bacterium]